MIIIKKISVCVFITLLTSCTEYQKIKTSNIKDKKYFASAGFALIYDDSLYINKTINKKINNEDLVAVHSFLKRNTLVKIINPENEKEVTVKISKNAEYPKIFNIVITNRIAKEIELNIDDPLIEILEVKKNKTFIAKESNIFDEEKEVAQKAPVDSIQMNDLSINKTTEKNKNKKIKDNKNFYLIISDFYYFETAEELKNDLITKTKVNKFYVKKIKDNKFRLSVGPFKNFNALKSTYISLNNLGFDELNVYKE
tara:strand:+ start:13343 stop:14107 length:765 start_codon:yes stop_codon:yes gene_type:complete